MRKIDPRGVVLGNPEFALPERDNGSGILDDHGPVGIEAFAFYEDGVARPRGVSTSMGSLSSDLRARWRLDAPQFS